MKRVLFVLKSFLSHNRPNALCVEAVSRDLKKQGVVVDYLSMEQGQFDDVYEEGVYPVTVPAVGRLKTSLSKFFYAPIADLNAVTYLFKELRRLTSEKKYDAVIAVVYPPEAAQAAVMLKRERPDLNVMIYEIDSCSNRYKKPKGLLQRWIKNRTIRWECDVYNTADHIIHMRSHKKHYLDRAFDRFAYKSVYLDIPNFEVNVSKAETQSSGTKRLLYAGAFYPDIREPDYMLKLLNAVCGQTDISLTLYTGNKYKSWLSKKISGYYFVKLHSEVSQEELKSICASYDLLVSIGNRDNDSLPSKTLLYMGSGRPIVHFFPDDNDASLRYFRHYPNLFLVDQRKEITLDLIHDFQRFISADHPTVNMESLKNLLIENTPEYTAKEFIRLLYEAKNQ